MSELFVNANALSIPLGNETMDMCVTSPPYYGLRDYGNPAQLGLEETPEGYVANMVSVFREVWRVMKPQGTLWLNIGDSYSGGGNYRGIHSEDSLTSKQRSNRGARGVSQALGGKVPEGTKPKDLIGIPWMLAFALRANGWYLRSDIIWHKPNPMPESVTDRPTKSHEYIFLLSKQRDYYYDADAIKEEVAPSSIERMEYGWNSDRPGAKVGPNGIHTERMGERFVKPLAKNLKEDGQSPNTFHQTRALGIPDKQYYARNKRSVWTVTTKPYKGAHFATFPPDLIEPCIKAGCPRGGIVLDPFVGSGTTCWVARKLERHAVGLDISFAYLHEQARGRLQMDVPVLI